MNVLHAQERRSSTPDFTIRQANIEIRIYDYSIYIYKVLRNGSVYEDEFSVLDVQGMGEVPPDETGLIPDEMSHFKQSFIFGFDSLTKDPNKAIWRLTATAKPIPAKAEIILDMDPSTVAPDTVKFA
jgi:hypothetical protein